jgi:hypothetical protein
VRQWTQLHHNVACSDRRRRATPRPTNRLSCPGIDLISPSYVCFPMAASPMAINAISLAQKVHFG